MHTLIALVARLAAVAKQAIDYDAAAPALPDDAGVGVDHASRGEAFVFSPDPIQLSEGYAPSFTAEQADEIKAFFKRYGVVIIRDVLSPDQVTAAAAEVFETAGLGSTPPQTLEELERVNWEDVYGSRYNRSKGFIGYDAPDSDCAWRSRLAPALYSAYSTLFGRKDLLVKLDRFGLMRPTLFGTGSESEILRKDWQTTGEWIHWDQNPWEETSFVRIQGVLALSDHTATSGGFHCVPAFCTHWQAWAAANEEYVLRRICLLGFVFFLLAFAPLSLLFDQEICSWSRYRSDADLVAVPHGDSMRPHLQRLPMCV